MVVENASTRLGRRSGKQGTDHAGATARTLLEHLILNDFRLDNAQMLRANQVAIGFITPHVVRVTALQALGFIAFCLWLFLLFVLHKMFANYNKLIKWKRFKQFF